MRKELQLLNVQEAGQQWLEGKRPLLQPRSIFNYQQYLKVLLSRYSHQRKTAKQAALKALDTLSETKEESTLPCTSTFDLMQKSKKVG